MSKKDKKPLTYENIENKMLELEVEADSGYTFFEEIKGSHRIFLEDIAIEIPKHNLEIRSGIFEAYEKESGEYEADFSFYMFFDSNTKKWLYEEQGSSIKVCLNNYLNIIGEDTSMDALENLEWEMKVEPREKTS